MPGPLVEGHAKLEKDCANCHESFVKGGQTKLCLECHKPIANDLAAKKGMHGRRPDVVGRECRSCHSDHKGRTADIVQLDRQVFNHTFTNFELKGSHTRVACDGCHAATKKFRDAPGRCFDCHKKNDPHKGGLGEACDGCHTEDAWRKVKAFDHSKTKFALTGAHAKVACAACHAGERYKGLATTCISCHQIQDVHAGRHGAKCESCHGTQAWKPVRFDHAKNTRFPLRGSHATLKCEACHMGDVYRDKLAMTCVSCHKKNDPHKGQLGTRCEQCHNETGWRQKVTFDHDITRFPLIGLHAAVACEDCHRTPSFKDAPRACSGCHKDTHHEGRLGRLMRDVPQPEWLGALAVRSQSADIVCPDGSACRPDVPRLSPGQGCRPRLRRRPLALAATAPTTSIKGNLAAPAKNAIPRPPSRKVACVGDGMPATLTRGVSNYGSKGCCINAISIL